MENKASQLKNAAPEATAECIPTTHATANVPTSKSRPLPAVPQTTSSKPSSPIRPTAPASRPAKGLSNGPVPIASDKENDNNAPQSIDAVPSLKNPKRAKGGGPTSRAASREAQDHCLFPNASPTNSCRASAAFSHAACCEVISWLKATVATHKATSIRRFRTGAE